jgi:cyclohexanecarboxyl-CoA dehydrogenase
VIDFSFTPAQQEYREALRKLAREELLPRYAEGDAGVYPTQQIQRINAFSDEFWRGREQEWDLIACGITAEEVARGDFNCVLPSLGRPYQSQLLTDFSEAQHERWSEKLASGEEMIALGITEPQAGSDMAKLAARAEKKGKGWVIDGIKSSVSFLDAGLFYVFVRTDPKASGWQGISGFLVPRDTPGLTFEPYDDLGCRGIPRGILRMEGVEVPQDAMVGPPGTAFLRISRFFDVNRAIIGLKCIGAALQSVAETIAWAREREVFGQPLTANQGVTFPLAEGVTHLDHARLGCYRVLWMRQNQIPCRHEGAMVKWWAPKTAADVIHKCLTLHGHLGYTSQLPIGQRLRDVIGWQIGDGAEEVMKLLVARELMTGAATE